MSPSYFSCIGVVFKVMYFSSQIWTSAMIVKQNGEQVYRLKHLVLSFMCHPSDATPSQRERDLEEKRWMQCLSYNSQRV